MQDLFDHIRSTLEQAIIMIPLGIVTPLRVQVPYLLTLYVGWVSAYTFTAGTAGSVVLRSST